MTFSVAAHRREVAEPTVPIHQSARGRFGDHTHLRVRIQLPVPHQVCIGEQARGPVAEHTTTVVVGEQARQLFGPLLGQTRCPAHLLGEPLQSLGSNRDELVGYSVHADNSSRSML